MHRKYESKLSKYIYKPDMKARAKHDCDRGCATWHANETESVSIIGACTKLNR